MTQTANLPAEPQTAATNTTAPVPKRPRRSVIRTLLFALLLGFLVLAGAITWLISTESGLRFGLYKIPAWAGVNIQSKTLQGTLLAGFKGDKWRIETEGADIDISRFTFAWQSQELWQKKLHINNIAAGDIHIQTKPTPPKQKSKAPSTLPNSISLPFQVAIDNVETGHITSGAKRQIIINSAQLNYQYDHQSHRIKLTKLQTPWSDSQGETTLALTTPFPLNGEINSTGILDEVSFKNQISLSGSLRDLATNINLIGQGVRLNAEAIVHPFAPKLNEKINLIQIKGFGLNPKAFAPSAPKAKFEFDATVVPSFTQDLALDGSIDLANNLPLSADSGGIPVRTLVSDFTIDDNGVLKLQDTEINLLQKGVIKLSGSVDSSASELNLNADLIGITAADALTQKLSGSLNGNIRVQGNYTQPETSWNLKSGNTTATGRLQVATDAVSQQQTLQLEEAKIALAGGGETKLSGSLNLFKEQALKLAVVSKNFNPAKLNADFPIGNINGNIDLSGQLAQGMKLSGKMAFGPSSLSGVNLRGTADIVYDNAHLSRAITDIALGANNIKTNGSFGKRGDKLNLNINAPDLSRFGFGLSGLLTANGFVAGEPKKIEANLTGSARNLNFRKAVQIRSIDFKLKGSPDYTQPLDISLIGNNIVIPGKQESTRIDAVNLSAQGTGRQHHLHGTTSMALDGKPYKLEIDANGGLNDKQQWKGSLGVLNISGAFNLRLQNRIQLEAGAEHVSMSNARWSAMGGSLNLDSFVWDKKQGITTKGNASNLHISELHNFYTPPVKHNMVLAGEWDLSYSENTRGYLNIRRQSGDVVLPYREQILGLSELSLNTRFRNGRIDSAIKGNTRYGVIDGNVLVSQQFGNDITLAPIGGRIHIGIPQLESLRNFFPVGQTVRGKLNGEAVISGRVGQPLLNGTLNGENLYYRGQDTGVILDNGTLRSRLQGQSWIIDGLTFRRGDGNVTLRGNVALQGSEPDVNVNAIFTRYRVVDKPNRRLTLSGTSSLLYSPSTGVTLTGKLKADEGHFGMQKSAMPSLDDDVVVLGEVSKEKVQSTPVTLDLTLDLGNRVRFSGQGLDVTLGGALHLTSQPGRDVQGVGAINVIKGQYKAYGQDLDIEKGTISFIGPLSSPNLNIRASRRLSPVGAGVEILGNLNTPRVRLVSNEPMSEKDKLSWLILGRASSGESDEATLAAAAGAWLAGSVNDRLGLVDDFGLTTKRTRNAQTGELNAAEQVLTFGKRITDEVYLGYEYSINSADQAVKLIYQVSKAWQLIARAGSDSFGGEAKYVIRFD